VRASTRAGDGPWTGIQDVLTDESGNNIDHQFYSLCHDSTDLLNRRIGS